jgi:ADP-ribosylglycohydrolase
VLGLATGDAVGTTLEFESPGSFEPISDVVGGGPFGLQRGEWTDDTSMMMCLGTSLVVCRGFDPFDQMERYVKWYRTGYMSSNGKCFDIGSTVRAALHKFESTSEPYCGRTERFTAGNGSLMRLAVVFLAFVGDPIQAIEFAALSSLTTHGAVVAVDGCRFMAALIVGAVSGAAKEELLFARLKVTGKSIRCAQRSLPSGVVLTKITNRQSSLEPAMQQSLWRQRSGLSTTARRSKKDA